MKKTGFVICAAAGLFAASAGAVDFDRPSGRLELPPAPKSSPVPSSAGGDTLMQPKDSYKRLVGIYKLEKAEAGNCYENIEIVTETSQISETGSGLGIYGLPRGSGRVVAQVLDINAGIKYDLVQNPMIPTPDRYRPRVASFNGVKLVSKVGEVFPVPPPGITAGEIVEAESVPGGLKVRSGEFTQAGVTVKDACSYKRE